MRDENVLVAGPCRVELVPVPPGEFVMGSAAGLDLEQPPHRVTLSRGFRLGRFPVTQEQWRAVMGTVPSEFSGAGDLPVENVSWDDARTFCAVLSRLAGRSVRLPTEAEWEYACRAGSAAEYHFGGTEEE